MSRKKKGYIKLTYAQLEELTSEIESLWNETDLDEGGCLTKDPEQDYVIVNDDGSYFARVFFTGSIESSKTKSLGEVS